MCKELFPQLTFELEIEPQYDGSDYQIHIQELSLSEIGKYIHWFEFCMTHLAKKILKNNCFKITAVLNGVLFRNAHPINILYCEFKKSKIKL